jgi:hypothetical protein
MTGPGLSPVAALGRALNAAQDDQIARIVAVVDAMAERGAADALIAPLRARLARLRLARPPGFARLLFTPLDPVIVAPAAWRRGMPFLPRVVLRPLAREVRAALPALARQVEDAASRPGPQAASLRARLWAEAARLLPTLTPDADWRAQTGLAEPERAALVGGIVAVLIQAEAIDCAMQHARHGMPEADRQLRDILLAAVPHGVEAWSMLVAVLLGQSPQPDRVVTLAAELAPGREARAALEAALDHTLDLAAADAAMPAGATDAATAGETGARLATLVERLGQLKLPTERRRRLEQVRRRAAESCLACYAAAAETTLLAPIRTAAGALSDAEMAALEAVAQDLRELEETGRRLGASDRFDPALRQAAAALRITAPALTLADRVRLTELLAGPEVALALLQ